MQNNISFDLVANGDPFVFRFRKMLCTLNNSRSAFVGTMFVIEDPLENYITVNVSYKNHVLNIDLPKTDLINERGEININSSYELKGSFEKIENHRAPICYQLISNGIKVELLCKHSNIFGFINIPIKSTKLRFRDYDTLRIEIDWLRE